MAVNVNFYRSTDTGAPIIDGQVGSLITLLDAVLINGYNSKTITITRSGATATATCTTHGFNDLQTILISGAVQTDYNGTFRITNVTANTFDFTVANSPTTPATGTITAMVNPAGWTKPYSASNIAAYRSGTGSNQRYYRIDDNGPTNAYHANLVGYGAMTDVNTGTDRFPTAVQYANGLIIHKSTAAGVTTRDWAILATPKICYLYIDAETVSGSWSAQGSMIAFGDYVSTVPGDTFNSFIRANTNVGVSYNTFGDYGLNQIYAMREWTGIGSAKQLYQFWWGGTLGASGGNLQYPCPITGDIHMTQMKLLSVASNTQYHVVGYMPGLWGTGFAASAGPANGDTWTGTNGSLGDLTGKTFIKFDQYSSVCVVFEISDTW